MDEALRTFLAASKASYYWTPAGNSERMKKEIEEVGLGVPIIETRKIGLENVMQVVF